MFGHTFSGLLAASLVATLMSTAPILAQDTLALEVTAQDTQTAPTVLSLDELDTFEQVSFKTTTIWTDGEVVFSGVPLKALLEQLEAEGETVQLIALNDYTVSMPMSELEDYAPIVATRMNGQPMKVRDKGPFWVVYPFDLDEKYRTETVFSRSIWQLNRLKVMK